MTQEDKELLLKDLCARLPYGVKVLGPWEKDGPCELSEIDLTSSQQIRVFEDRFSIEDCKPYLRPISSMTEEEMKEYQAFFNYDGVEYPEEYIDWLNKKMFAYRTIDGKDMFELGLVLEAPKDMYTNN